MSDTAICNASSAAIMSLGSLSAGWRSGELEDSGKQTKSPRRCQGLVRGDTHIVLMSSEPVRTYRWESRCIGREEGRCGILRDQEPFGSWILSINPQGSEFLRERREGQKAGTVDSQCLLFSLPCLPAWFVAILPSLSGRLQAQIFIGSFSPSLCPCCLWP